MLPFAAIVLLFYFIILRPARARQKKHEGLITSLKKGDRVITNGGIYGMVDGVRDNTIMLKVSEQVKIEISKSAVVSLQAPRENAS